MQRCERLTEIRAIGARIRQMRIACGMSQEKLGEYLDVTFQQIQKYEKGDNRISADSLARCAAAFDVSINYFFDHTATLPPSRATTAIDKLSTYHAKRIIDICDKLKSPAIISAWLAMGKALATESQLKE
jgi:transcriptional regulator with XRE-family HTH domain